MPSIADVFVTVLPETRKIAPGIRDAFREVDPSAREAGARWGREIQQGIGKPKVELQADTAKAKAEIDIAARDRHSTIHLDVDRDRLASSMSSAVSQMGPALAGEATSAGSSLGTSMGAGLGPALMGAGVAAIAGIASSLAGLSALAPAGLLGAGGVIGTLVVGLDGVKDAYDAVNKASQSSGTDQAAQAREVTSAQRGLTDAVQSQSQAQKDVANAYRDARNQLDDLNLSLKGGQISEAQAYNDVLKARRDLARGGFKDQLELNDANLRVQESEQRWQESRQRNVELTQKAADANAKGVAGSDVVASANERLRKSNEQVAASQDTLNVAQSKTSSAAQDAVKAMALLSPQAQAFVDTLMGLKPAFQEFKNSVQDALFTNLGPQFQQLAATYMPLLQGFMTGMASTLNQSFSQISGILQSPEMLKTMQSVFTNLGDAFRNFMPAIGPMTEAFLKLSEVGSSFLPQLGTAAVQAAQGFSKFITEATQSGQLQQWIQTGITALGQLSDVMGYLTRAFFALSPIGTAVLGMLQQVLPTLLPSVGPLAQAFADWVVAITPLLTMLGQLITTLMPTFISMMGNLSGTITTTIQVFKDLNSAIVPASTALASMVSTDASTTKFFNSMRDSISQVLNPLSALVTLFNTAKELFTGDGSAKKNAADLLAAAQKAAQDGTPIPPEVLKNLVTPGFAGGGGSFAPPTQSGAVPSFSFGPSTGIGSFVVPRSRGGWTPAPNQFGTPAAPAAAGSVYTGPHTEDTHGLLVPDAAQAKQVIQQMFGIKDIGGYRSPDGYNEHSSGEALDIMVGANKALGDQVNQFLMQNADALGLQYDIWQQAMHYPDGSVKPMSDRGSPTQNHMDHVHARFKPGSAASGQVAPPGATAFAPPDPSAVPHMPAMPGGSAGDPMYVALPDAQVQQMSPGQQLGQDIFGGIAQIFGFDGSVFKDPTQFGLFKLFKGAMGLKPAGGDGSSLASPGGGGSGLSGLLGPLAGFIPQPMGALKSGSPADAPTEFMPAMPNAGGGNVNIPALAQSGQTGAPGPGNTNNNQIVFNGPVGNPSQAMDAANQANVPRMRQGIRPLPS